MKFVTEQRSVIKTGHCQHVSNLAVVSASALAHRNKKANVFKAGKGIIVCFICGKNDNPQTSYGREKAFSCAEYFHPPKQVLGAEGTQKLLGSGSWLCRLLLRSFSQWHNLLEK